PLVEDKSNLAPLRLVSFVALAVTTAHFVGHNSRLLHCRVAQLIIRCGQHSLQVFCLGIVLSVLGSILVTFRDDILMQLAIDFGGIVLMAGTAALLTWYKASNATHADAVVAASGHFETRRRKVVGIERHVIVWAQGVGGRWGRAKRGRREVRWRSHPYPTAKSEKNRNSAAAAARAANDCPSNPTRAASRQSPTSTCAYHPACSVAPRAPMIRAESARISGSRPDAACVGVPSQTECTEERELSDRDRELRAFCKRG